MASVDQTRAHCVNQIGKTHSKHLEARHGRGTVWARMGTACCVWIGLFCVLSIAAWCWNGEPKQLLWLVTRFSPRMKRLHPRVVHEGLVMNKNATDTSAFYRQLLLHQNSLFTFNRLSLVLHRLDDRWRTRQASGAAILRQFSQKPWIKPLALELDI